MIAQTTTKPRQINRRARINEYLTCRANLLVPAVSETEVSGMFGRVLMLDIGVL